MDIMMPIKNGLEATREIRVLRGLREENVIRIVDNKILILNADYLKPYAD